MNGTVQRMLETVGRLSGRPSYALPARIKARSAGSLQALHSGPVIQKSVVFPEESYAFLEPVSVHQVVDENRHDEQIRTHPVSIMELSDAPVLFNGQQGLVKTSEGETVAHYSVSDDQADRARTKRHKRLKGTTVLFGSSPGSNCYYHWMLDILPKLGILQKCGFNLDTIDHFLVRGTTQQFQVETLAHFGIHPDRIVQTRKKKYWLCDHLIHVELNNGINMKMNRFIPHWFKHVMPAPVENAGSMKLYISRPEGVRRGISNEQELLPVLHEFGYAVMPMEGLSVAEQVKLMGRVSVLVSPHGGALTNMVFCRPGTRVCELFGPHVYPFYYGLSQLCGHQYYTLMQQPDLYPRAVQYHTALMAGSHEQQMKTVTRDFSVDVAEFRSTLELLDN